MEQIARTAEQIASAIRRERRQKGLTQEQLSEKVQLRQATISKLESSKPAIQLQTLLDVMRALNLEFVIRSRTKASSRDIENLL
jgi:HTH-type transcriptional regulator/antitoxin HipB